MSIYFSSDNSKLSTTKLKVCNSTSGYIYFIVLTMDEESIPPDRQVPIGTSLLKCNSIFLKNSSLILFLAS